MLAIPRLKLRLLRCSPQEKLQEEKAFVDNWPPERNYLFFLAKYTLINYTVLSTFITQQSDDLRIIRLLSLQSLVIIDAEAWRIPF